MARREVGIFLAEYQAAQESAEHHDNLIWANGSILWGGSVALFGFVIVNLDRPQLFPFFGILAGFALAFSLFSWRAVFIWNDVMGQKYQRCKQIELLLGMWQHRGLRYPKNSQKVIYSAISVYLISTWIFILLYTTWGYWGLLHVPVSKWLSLLRTGQI
jgi:hypothetical protein